MFRFSCFNANVQINKPKKIVQPSSEAMAKTSQDDSPKQVSNDPSITTSSNPSPSKVHKQMNVNGNQMSNQDSVENICRPEDLDRKSSSESDVEVRQTRHIKKSQSLASGLYQEGRRYTGYITEGEADRDFSFNDSKSRNESPVSTCRKDHDIIPTDQCNKNPNSEFQFSSGRANDGSIFSIGDLAPSDKDAQEISDTPLSGEFAGDSAEQTSGPSTPTLMKSHSLPDFEDPALSSRTYTFKHPPSISRSSNDLHALGKRQKEVFVNESDDQIRGDQGESDLGKMEESHMDSYFNDGIDSYLTSASAKDWVMPITDEMIDVETLQGDSSVDYFGEYPNKDFKIKRIEDWVIGLQHCGPPLEIINELPESVDPVVDVNTKNGVTAAEVDHKVIPGMEAAKIYISSLSANATAAQLANHGLVVIPFLSAFVSLKVLNLAGNSIVRITAGALPRGLHVLNLSKNNISTIEGLRELTRLRVLDLSYNRILRIGHGLASCSSLKELYLAGNKISEVEGLHRLLKLTILDLRFNKISTTKCLGQLAANYNSLQAISLEGNPAQKNVGDEQLKKCLQGLLPHLVYYNRQPIKMSTLKDGAERSVRLGMNTHQFDRSLRSDRKTTTKKTTRPSTSSTHARRSQTVESPKLSKGKQNQLPPSTRTRGSTQSRYHFDVPSEVLNMTSELSIRKSRSEGALGAL
ncbi:putative leucine-rich repeat domain, L domain-containing protein [Lupinus albus]|uniref:Putative leucine-rich repeat domain, L domain-containing protein n=1 Tax=Lupinus albus TaxID=3870 RepID=A0A6A4NLS0_LUPAL|nr:putative leucine-rich repeat domain, L domain-containing protein [Lupinus albus]